jgi:TetR/AcrR family transcriptional repressor of nem operon
MNAEAITRTTELPEKKRNLIDATVRLILRQGYAGTTVDQICAEAGVTKGSFFHYFASKEEICGAAMDAWTGGWLDILAMGKLDKITDPLDRLFHLFDIMEAAYLYPEIGPGCVVGTVAQEAGSSNSSLSRQCAVHLDTWKEGVRELLADAKSAHTPVIDFEPDSVADFLLGIVQGTLLVAKTRPDRTIVLNNVRHCRAYMHSLFGKNASFAEAK